MSDQTPLDLIKAKDYSAAAGAISDHLGAAEKALAAAMDYQRLTTAWGLTSDELGFLFSALADIEEGEINE